MATRQMKKNELKFEDFEPVSELQELPDKYTLIVNLSGFRKEDFRVQVDALGKLSVKGQKQFDDNKCKRFNKIFQLPSDSDIEKIRGKFEGEVLSLTFPRREKALPSNQEVKSSTEEAEAKPKDEAKASEKKEEETKPKASEKKEEETKPKEEPKQNSQTNDEAASPKEAETDEKVEDEPKTNGEKREELAKAKEETSMPKIKEAASRVNDAINKWKQSISSGKNKEKTMKRNEEKKIVTWKERISQEARGWSEYASFDSMKETINRNKKEIAVAVAAFSIGFFISRKLCSRK